MHACMCVCIMSSLVLFFEAGSLTKPGAHQIDWPDWPASSLLPPSWDHRSVRPCLFFGMGEESERMALSLHLYSHPIPHPLMQTVCSALLPGVSTVFVQSST